MLEWFKTNKLYRCRVKQFSDGIKLKNIEGTQMSIVEIKVPDIGGHENVDIIAVEVEVATLLPLTTP